MASEKAAAEFCAPVDGVNCALLKWTTSIRDRVRARMHINNLRQEVPERPNRLKGDLGPDVKRPISRSSRVQTTAFTPASGSNQCGTSEVISASL